MTAYICFKILELFFRILELFYVLKRFLLKEDKPDIIRQRHPDGRRRKTAKVNDRRLEQDELKEYCADRSMKWSLPHLRMAVLSHSEEYKVGSKKNH